MDGTGQQCAECLGPVSAAVHAQNGASLCPQCAEQFYCPCAGCGGLIPQDEAVLRDGALCCVQCLTAPVSDDAAAALSEEALAALVAEFIRLHAEAKQLNDRLDAGQRAAQAACGLPTADGQRRDAARGRARRQMWL